MFSTVPFCRTMKSVQVFFEFNPARDKHTTKFLLVTLHVSWNSWQTVIWKFYGAGRCTAGWTFLSNHNWTLCRRLVNAQNMAAKIVDEVTAVPNHVQPWLVIPTHGRRLLKKFWKYLLHNSPLCKNVVVAYITKNQIPGILGVLVVVFTSSSVLFIRIAVIWR